LSFDVALSLDESSEDGSVLGIKLGTRSTLGAVRLGIDNSPEVGFKDGSSLGLSSELTQLALLCLVSS
jgi:hypothetical protein